MRTKIIEAVRGELYLKAMIGRFDAQEWRRPAYVNLRMTGRAVSLLRQEGWTDRHFTIQDLATPGVGQIFYMDGRPDIDLKRKGAQF